MRILVIEDDFVSRRVLGRFLDAFGAVTSAVDGPDGLSTLWNAAAEGKPFDLVLLDVQMPGIDGLEVLRQIRAEEATSGRPATRAVMTTANDSLDTVKQAYQALCDGFLVKPVRKAALYRTLETLGIPLPA
jgi:two-component system chemotaxis response regulator CheY